MILTRLLCVSVFLACLIAMFFIALYFATVREKEYWQVRCENTEEYAKVQAEKIDELEKQNNELLTKGE